MFAGILFARGGDGEFAGGGVDSKLCVSNLFGGENSDEYQATSDRLRSLRVFDGEGHAPLFLIMAGLFPIDKIWQLNIISAKVRTLIN